MVPAMRLRPRNATAPLWTFSALGVLGTALSLFPPYRDLLGVVGSPADLALRSAPVLATTALHAWSAVRVTALRSAGGAIVRLCGVFDMVVGAAMLIPWLGLWVGLLSPASTVFFVASIHTPQAASRIAYVVASAATFGAGLWILTFRPEEPRNH